MDSKTNSYECMFLVDPNSDFEAASAPARAILDRYGADVLTMKPWDERRLAYEIRGRRRGLYILTYFKAPPQRIAEMERDSQLDERVLRMLILRRDNLTDEQVQADTPATASARRAARRAEERAARTEAPEAEAPPKAEAPEVETPEAEAPEAEAPPKAEAPEAQAPQATEAEQGPPETDRAESP
jgi:small subunit ribosomal protein S6